MLATDLAPLDHALVAISALTASGDVETLKNEVGTARSAGVEACKLREACMLATLFAGFPRGIVAQQALAQVLGPVGPEDLPDRQHDDKERREAGEAVFRAIHGRTAQAQLDMISALPAVFQQMLLGEAYGRVIARELLDLRQRELVAVACLTVLELPLVLKAHLLAARRHGASRGQLDAAVRLACSLSGRPLAAPIDMVGRL